MLNRLRPTFLPTASLIRTMTTRSFPPVKATGKPVEAHATVSEPLPSVWLLRMENHPDNRLTPNFIQHSVSSFCCFSLLFFPLSLSSPTSNFGWQLHLLNSSFQLWITLKPNITRSARRERKVEVWYLRENQIKGNFSRTFSILIYACINLWRVVAIELVQ